MPKRSRKRSYTVGVDMGGTKMLAGLVDDRGDILSRKKWATASEEGAEATVERMVDGILSAVGDGGVPLDRVQGIGIGAPGPLDPETGVVLCAPNLKWKESVPLKEMVEERVGRPTFVDNDVNLGTLGESISGAGKGVSDLVGIFVGTGIGGGLVLGGELFEGFNRTAGEVGHFVLEPNGPVCGCGVRGHLEALASRTAMERDIREAIQSGEVSMISELTDLTSEAYIKSGVLAKAYRQGDPVVVRVINDACRYLGMAVGSLLNLLSPQMVILGGGVIEALGEQMMPLIRQTAAEYAFPQAIKDVRIVSAQLGDDAGVLGAAELARRKVGATQEAEPPPQPKSKPDSGRRVHIDEAGFGYIVIDGKLFERDVVIGTDGRVQKRQKKLSRKEHGTAHSVCAAELKAVLKGQAPELLLVGTGASGGLSLGEDAVAWLDKKGMAYRAVPTPDVVVAFNDFDGTAAALIHVTC